MKNGVLIGRAALITGANQGLGLAIARAFVKAGASVMLCARDEKLLAEAGMTLRKETAAGQKVIWSSADVSDPVAVERIVVQTAEQLPGFCILVNNAGVYGPKGPLEAVDWTEWKRAVEINLFGSVLICRAVVPHFKRRHYGKIIQLSGGGATKALPFISAYAASKTAIVRLAETLAEEVRDDHIDVNALAPGPLNTRLLDEVLNAGPARVGQVFYDQALRQKAKGGVPLELGAGLAVFLASAASDGITGRLISAQWDDWQHLPARKDALRETDVYTLRRITPKDRGLPWEL